MMGSSSYRSIWFLHRDDVGWVVEVYLPLLNSYIMKVKPPHPQTPNLPNPPFVFVNTLMVLI